MGEGDDRREIVEGEGCDRQHLVAGERAAFVEQGTLSVEEGIMHARQATGAVLAPSELRGSAHLFAVDRSPLAWPSLRQVGVLPLRQHARRARKKRAPPPGVERRGPAPSSGVLRCPVTQR